MKRALIATSLLVACSGGDKKPPPATPPTELVNCPACGGPVRMPVIDGGLAQGIAIQEISAWQTLKYPIAINGNAADPGRMRLASKRQTLLRLALKTDASWAPHPITATIRMVTVMPEGFFVQSIVTPPFTPPTKPADDGALDSTVNIDLPAEKVLAYTSFSVWLTDPQGKPAQEKDAARYPKDGSLAPLGAEPFTEKLRIRIVPVQYDADGSGRLPDTSEAMLDSFRKIFFKIYPVGQVEVSVREQPFPWSSPISFSGQGWDQLLTAIGGLRGMDNLPPEDADIYYYGMFCPAASQGGGIAGLSPISAPYSIGVGYPGEGTVWVAAHEVGHAHGLAHAPCGGAGGPDPMFPYPDGSIGVWGYDQIAKKTIDPAQKIKDLMSYCQPQWISDYHYNHAFGRVQSDNRIVLKDVVDDPMWEARVDEEGTVTVGEVLHKRWPNQYGELREIDIGGTRVNARWFPYDHLPGGVLMVPETVRSAAKHTRVRMIPK